MTSKIKPLYRGTDEADRLSPDELKNWLENPPPWRDHRKKQAALDWDRGLPDDVERGDTYVSTGEKEQDAVNLALWLRRPLLVTGKPGVGKSSLAYGIAHALRLGPPLRWEINSQSTLKDGLYTYDAIGHFRASREASRDGETQGDGRRVSPQNYVTLGPLGTAFLPTERPRVLLIDELDKASWDLPNSLLHIFEEGAFRIPELDEHVPDTKNREAVAMVKDFDQKDKDAVAMVKLSDRTSRTERVAVASAQVRCHQLPVVVITSNGDREFSPAFLRRCVQLDMETLSTDVLTKVVESQFGRQVPDDLQAKLKKLEGQETDIVLQALFAASMGADLEQARDKLKHNRDSR